ncbi:MAG: glycosyltransferase family 39 protein [Planctomycetes bacterium]|nr:glycosyltransferase family 39 protein [Planctomycetota bacterium]
MRSFAVIVFLVAVLLITLSQARRDLWAPDEPRHAEVARTMVVSSEWLVPKLNGEIYPDKPPPPFWLMGGFMKLFGTHEWAARVPTVIAAASILALTVIIADLLAIPSAALLAVLILASSFRSWWLFQRVSLDVLMTAFVCVSIVGWLRHWRGRGSAAVNGVLFLGGMAAGVSMKGPLAIVVALAAAVGHGLSMGMARKLVERRFLLPGLLAFAVIIAAWVVPLWLATDAAYHDELFFKQSAGRIASAWNHEAPFWYYLYDFPVEFMPWTPLLALGMFALIKFRPKATQSSWTLLFSWTVPTFLFLSVVQSKRGNYLLPLYPAFALLASLGLHELLALGGAWTRRVRVVAWIGLSFLGLATLAVAASAFIPAVKDQGINVPIGAALVALFVGAVFVLRGRVHLQEGRPDSAIREQGFGVVAVLVLAAVFVLPAVDAAKSGRVIAERLRDQLPSGSYVPMLGLRADEYCFYSNLAFREVESKDDFIAALRRADVRYALADTKDLAKLRKKVALPEGVVECTWETTGSRRGVSVLEVNHRPADGAGG